MKEHSFNKLSSQHDSFLQRLCEEWSTLSSVMLRKGFATSLLARFPAREKTFVTSVLLLDSQTVQVAVTQETHLTVNAKTRSSSSNPPHLRFNLVCMCALGIVPSDSSTQLELSSDI